MNGHCHFNFAFNCNKLPPPHPPPPPWATPLHLSNKTDNKQSHTHTTTTATTNRPKHPAKPNKPAHFSPTPPHPPPPLSRQAINNQPQLNPPRAHSRGHSQLQPNQTSTHAPPYSPLLSPCAHNQWIAMGQGVCIHHQQEWPWPCSQPRGLELWNVPKHNCVGKQCASSGTSKHVATG